MIQHHTGTFSKGIHHSFIPYFLHHPFIFRISFQKWFQQVALHTNYGTQKLWQTEEAIPLLSVCVCLKASYHILLYCNIFYVDPNITEKEALTRFGIPPIATMRETGSFSYSS